VWQEGRLKCLLGHGDIIKMNFKYIECSWVDSAGSGYNAMTVEIYWSTKLLSASQQELCCMELDVLCAHWTPNNNCSRYSAL